jgi:hypothetical protein
LENAQAKVLGVVLNAIKAEISPDFYQFSYSLYRYYGHEEDETGKTGNTGLSI